MGARGPTLLLGGLLLGGSFVARPAAAQVGAWVAVGVAGGGSGLEHSVLQVGVRIARPQPGFTPDVELMVLPTALAVPTIIALPNLDVAYAVPLGRYAFLVPRLGASVLLDDFRRGMGVG